MISNFKNFNEGIGFKIPGQESILDDLPRKKRPVGFRPSWKKEENEPEEIEIEYDNIPNRLKNRRAFTPKDLIDILTWLKDRTNVETQNKIDHLANQLGLDNIGEMDINPMYKYGIRHKNSNTDYDDYSS